MPSKDDKPVSSLGTEDREKLKEERKEIRKFGKIGEIITGVSIAASAILLMLTEGRPLDKNGELDIPGGNTSRAAIIGGLAIGVGMVGQSLRSDRLLGKKYSRQAKN